MPSKRSPASVTRAAKAICRERYGRFVWFTSPRERAFCYRLAEVALAAAEEGTDG